MTDECDSRTTRLVSDTSFAVLRLTILDSLIKGTVLIIEEIEIIGLMELELAILAMKR